MKALFITALAVIFLAIIILFGRRYSRTKRWLSILAGSIVGNAIPLFYCSLMAFFLALFDREFLNNFSKFSVNHKRFIRFCYLLPFASMARLYFSDPGRITRQNWGKTKWTSPSFFDYDRILYMPNNECSTCSFLKLARSKHCSVCNSCIAMQDHHCIWVNNCVGLLNFRWFLLFLATNAYILAYGWCLLVVGLLDSIKLAYHDPERFWFWSLAKQGSAQNAGICLLLLCTVLLPLVIVFLGFHLRYVWGGVTTNEADKWEDIAALIPDRTLYKYPNTSILLLKYKDGSFNRNLNDAELTAVDKSEPQLVDSVNDIPNIYDRGFLNNLRLLLFL